MLPAQAEAFEAKIEADDIGRRPKNKMQHENETPFKIPAGASAT